MAALALGYLALAFAADSGADVVPWAIGVLAVVFITEFAVRLWNAPSRYAYLRSHWLDLVSSIPLVGGLRALRILRLLRLGAAARLLVVAEHAALRRGSRQSFWFLGPFLFIVWFGAATAYWNFEHGTNPNLHTYGDALYWAGITATTVGYGDVTPVTAEGRVIAGLLVFVGIGLIGFVSARLTSWLLQADGGQAYLADRISSLEREILSLRELLLSRHAQLSIPPGDVDDAPPMPQHMVNTSSGATRKE